MRLIRTFWSPPEKEEKTLLSQGLQNFGVFPKGREKGEE